MEETATTKNGYSSSYMRNYITNNIISNLTSIFGSHLLTIYQYTSCPITINTIGNTTAHIRTVIGTKAMLLSEIELFGTCTYSYHGLEFDDGTRGQLPLFKLDSRLMYMPNDGAYWLSTIVNDNNFCYCDMNGHMDHAVASNSMGIRPRFCIG